MPIIRRFIEWLSYHPTTEEIARAVATEYLPDFSVLGVRFGRINNDDSVTVLGQYGYPDADNWRERNVPSAEWRAVDSDHVRIITGVLKTKWATDSRMYVVELRDRGVVQGHLIIEFHDPVSDADKYPTAEAIEDLSAPLALYLSFLSRPIGIGSGLSALPGDTGNGQLSQRQVLILRGMVEGKTNHELATELGFSVSTIRHETMRIYQALAVSDRKEAAKKALTLSLVQPDTLKPSMQALPLLIP